MAAATGTKQQQHPHPAPPPGATVVDPKFEWTEKAGSYVLRLTLTGFRKDDFRVQVDDAGRLTVRGTKPGVSLHKVFQLPSAASLDDIAGRFEAGVLTLTMPKRAGVPTEEGAPKVTPREQVDGDAKTGDADCKKVPKPRPSSDAAPTSIEEIKTKPKEEGIMKPLPRDLDDTTKMPAKDDGSGKKEAVAGVEPKESTFRRTARQVVEHVQRMVEEANKRKQEQQKPRKEQEPKPKAPEAAAAAPTLEKLAPKLASSDKAMVVVDRESLAERERRRGEEERAKEQEPKPKAPEAAAAAPTLEKLAPKLASSDKAMVVVDRESLVERERRRGEEERAKAAAMATVMEARAEQEKKPAATACGGWKERMTESLGQLTDMKWADSAMEMARKNKEVVAVGITAFSLGFFVSQRLFKK